MGTNTEMMRQVWGLILFGSVFFLPWWTFVILGLAGCLIFANYYEVVFASFVYDLIYGFSGAGFIHHQFTFTIVSLLAMFLIEESKIYLRYYQR